LRGAKRQRKEKARASGRDRKQKKERRGEKETSKVQSTCSQRTR